MTEQQALLKLTTLCTQAEHCSQEMIDKMKKWELPDEEPLKFYRVIAEYASSALKSGGALYFEINPIYEKETREMLQELDFKDIETKEDAFGKKRMMKAKNNKE